jgi:SAM-dependent methyltransferase
MKQDTMPSVAAYWNEQASEFDSIYAGNRGGFSQFLNRHLRKDMYQRFDWVMKEAADLGAGSACDIGCGSGRFVAALAKRGASRVVGLDVAPNMLRLAEELAAREGVGKVCDFVTSDVIGWKTEDQFDLVIAIGLWDYIADPLPRLRVIRGLTKGKFLSTWPRLWTWRVPVRKIRLALKGCPVYFFREAEVRRYVEAAGFRVDSCVVLGKIYCVAASPVRS